MKYRGVKCLNCGYFLDLSDRFCAYCGQINTTKRLTLKDFVNEFILSVFTYDSRFRYTIKDLLFKPGAITRNYVEGKRIHYANPFRFFLSASISYFIILAIIAVFNKNDDFTFDDDGIVTFSKQEVQDDMDALKNIGDDIDLSNLKNFNEEDAAALEQKINENIEKSITNYKKKRARKDTTVVEKKRSYDYVSEDSINIAEGSFINRTIKKGILFYNFYEATGIKDPVEALDSLKYEKSKVNLAVYAKNDAINRVKENPMRFVRFLASKTPFFLFFFAPIFALFFWLIYSKKKFNYMEHLIFIFHIFSWVFLVLLIAILPDLVIGSQIIASLVILCIGPFYFYKALRNFYKQKRRYTLIKFVFLNIVFFMGSVFCALIFFAITAFLF